MGNNRKLSYTEKRYFQDKLKVEMLNEASQFMVRAIGWHLLHLDKDELKDTLTNLMVERDFLKIAALYGSKEQNQAKTFAKKQVDLAKQGRYPDPNLKDELEKELKNKIDNFPFDKSRPDTFLQNLADNTDAAGPFNAVKGTVNNKKYGLPFAKYYGVEFKTLQDHAAAFVNIRNTYCGHDTKTQVNAIDWDTINSFLDSVFFIIDFGKKDEKLAASAKELEEKLTLFKEELYEEPRIIEDEDAQIQFEIDFTNRYDPKERTLYMVRKPVFDEKMRIINQYKLAGARFQKEEKSRQPDTAVAADANAKVKNAAGAKHEVKVLDREISLNSFADSSDLVISQERLVELCSKSYVVADTSFWMAKDGPDYITRTLIPVLETCNNKLLIDWSTRSELFSIEVGLKDSVSEDEKDRAHKIRTAMRYLHESGKAIYIDNRKSCVTSSASILKLVMNNPSRHFWVLTKENQLVESLVAHGCRNVITSRLVNKTCKVHTCGRILMQWNNETATADRAEENKTAPMIKAVEKKENRNDTQTERVVKISGGSETNKPPRRNEKYKNSSKPKAVIPAAGEIVYVAGEPLRLGKKIGGGGEGDVYEILEDPDIAAKIYNEDHCDAQRFEKLTFMVDNNPQINELCWPQEIIRNSDGDFVGFSMKRVPNHYQEIGLNILMLNKPTIQKRILSGCNRLNLVSVCEKISRIFSRMHSKGILMGDVNIRNFMFNYESGEIVIVDCDSFQIGEFCCPVGTIEFTSPEIYARCGKDQINFSEDQIMREQSDDEFAMAVLLFRILMLNQSPYSAKGTTDLTEAIRNYRFGYRDTAKKDGDPSNSNNTGADTPDGPYRLIWNNTFYEIKQYFIQTFTGNGTVKANQWCSAFKRYAEAISSGSYTNELIPVLYLGSEEDYPHYICELCGSERNMHRDRMERKKKHGDLLLCKECENQFFVWQKEKLTERERCSKCGKTYEELRTTAAKFQIRNKPLICDDCREEVVSECPHCWRLFSLPKYLLRENRQKGRLPACQDCLEKTVAVCSVCHNTYETQKFKLNKYQQLICPNCLKNR